MPIKYDKLMALLKEKGYTTYKIRKDKLIGQGTLTALKNGTGGLDSKTISRLCKVLECHRAISWNTCRTRPTSKRHFYKEY